VSEQNVDLQRRVIDAYNARDIDALIACCDPEIELHPAFAGSAGGAIYRGHEELRTWHRDVEDAWEEIRGEPEAYFDLGDHTLTFWTLHGKGRQSGAEVAMPSAAVARSRDGLVVYFKAYTNRQEALRDLGVSEDALPDPIDP
jgi:ketosteroid isomerase-like protein